jgi:hypothetical protein
VRVRVRVRVHIHMTHRYLQLQYIALLIADVGSIAEGRHARPHACARALAPLCCRRVPQLAKAGKAIELLSTRLGASSP